MTSFETTKILRPAASRRLTIVPSPWYGGLVLTDLCIWGEGSRVVDLAVGRWIGKSNERRNNFLL